MQDSSLIERKVSGRRHPEDRGAREVTLCHLATILGSVTVAPIKHSTEVTVDFNTWLDKAWTDHADDTAGVAARLRADGPVLAQSADDVAALARIAQHVYGEHLGQYDAGRALLARLASHPQGGGAAPTLRVLDASLLLSAGGTDPRPGLEVPERIRVTAVAAGNLAERDARRAAALLQEAVADAEAAGLADADPACRALAVTGNNMACALAEKAPRSDDERALMVFAARTARLYWARAGTWLETERAEYRLARTLLAAGDPAEARRHAQACIEIVREHDSPALEAFFGWEALGLVERAAGNAPGHAHAVEEARQAFARLDAGDRDWCKTSLDALVAAGART